MHPLSRIGRAAFEAIDPQLIDHRQHFGQRAMGIEHPLGVENITPPRDAEKCLQYGIRLGSPLGPVIPENQFLTVRSFAPVHFITVLTARCVSPRVPRSAPAIPLANRLPPRRAVTRRARKDFALFRKRHSGLLWLV